MDLSEWKRRAWVALRTARAAEAEEIASALDQTRVLGVVGEAEVGKSQTVAQALALRPDSGPLLTLDLDGAADEWHVGWLVARAIARAAIGDMDVSLLAAEALAPERVRQRRRALTRVVGTALVEEAMRPTPTGEIGLTAALEAIDALVERSGAARIWIDHIEAPGLTPRHPVDVHDLLWKFRELNEREPLISLVISGRAAAERMANGPSAAFYGSGRWLTLARPTVHAWKEVGADLAIDPRHAETLAGLTSCHPQTTLLALSAQAVAGADVQPRDVMLDLIAGDDGLNARALQHARSLHRLGGQVLLQVAAGAPPFGAEQRGRTSRTEVAKVLERLRAAGLIARHGRGDWQVVNPLLAWRLSTGARSWIG